MQSPFDSNKSQNVFLQPQRSQTPDNLQSKRTKIDEKDLKKEKVIPADSEPADSDGEPFPQDWDDSRLDALLKRAEVEPKNS